MRQTTPCNADQGKFLSVSQCSGEPPLPEGCGEAGQDPAGEMQKHARPRALVLERLTALGLLRLLKMKLSQDLIAAHKLCKDS